MKIANRKKSNNLYMCLLHICILIVDMYFLFNGSAQGNLAPACDKKSQVDHVVT